MVRVVVIVCLLGSCAFQSGAVSDPSGDAGVVIVTRDAPTTRDTPVTSDAATDGQQVHGSIVVTRTITSGAIDLTSEGTSDWAEWGATNVTDFDHKATGGTQIANWTKIGAGTVYGYGNGYNSAGNDGFTWSDGVPVVAEMNPQYSGVWIDDAPNGFSTTAPASTATRTLRVYVGGASATGAFTVRLSDDSASSYVDVAGIGATDQGWAGVYNVIYNAASAGQTLTVSWVQSSSGGGDVNWSAASLQ